MYTCQLCGERLDPRVRVTVCVQCGWEPSPGPQYRYLELPVYEKLYGGAAGGGKTDALVMGALQHIHEPTYNAIIFRRTYPELIGQVIPKSQQWYRAAGGDYNQGSHCWTFPSGARIHFGHLQYEDDVHRYQGWELQYIGWDELTSFLKSQYKYMGSRLRSSAGIPATMASATNPGNEGHEWVLEQWAPWLRADDPDYKGVRAKPGEVMWYVVRDDARVWLTVEEAREINATWKAADPWERSKLPLALSSVFVPAFLDDNPHLLINDPSYAARLEDLDRHTKNQLKKGDWLSKPARGDFFQKEWFDIVDEIPRGLLAMVRWWDRAATKPEEGKKPDWTAGCKMGALADGRFIIADMSRFQERPTEVEANILSVASQDGRDVLVRGAKDPGSAGVFEADSYVASLAGYDVEFIRETGEKTTRARPVSSQAKARKILLLRGEWNRAFLNEAHDFPFGKKDQIDALSGAFSVLCSPEALQYARFKAAMKAARKAS